MAGQDLKRVYYHIIDDVVAKMKPEFVQEGVDEAVLHTIRQKWAQKLTQRGIITEGDDTARRDDDAHANSRKRAYDGTGPQTKHEVQPGSAAPGVLMAPGAVAMQSQQHHLPHGHLVPSGALPAMAHLQPGMAVRPVMPHPGMPGTMPANLQLAGNPHQLQALQALQALQQAGQPIPNIQQLQQVLLQQQLLQRQQQQQQQQQQQHHHQQQQQHQAGVIPQRDGSADLPASVSAAAAAAGMDLEHLKSVLPQGFAKALSAASSRATRERRLRGAAAAAAAGPVRHASRLQPAACTTNEAAAAADAAAVGNRQQGGAVSQQPQQQRKPRRRIPQVDGNDDDALEEEEEEEGDEDDEGDEVGDEAADEEPEEEDDEDDEEIANLEEELDAQEAADNEDIDNVGFALYEKVHRSKNRWRCNLRYGVFFINGREYMFNKGSTDLTF